VTEATGQLLSWTIGDVRVTRVAEVVVPVPRDYMVPGIADEQIDAQRPWIDPYFDADGALLLSFHTLVVESGGTTIVVDTCVGVDTPRIAPGDPTFPDRLAAAIEGGLEAVDVVLCTHLHFDHVGWNMRTIDGRTVPTFPNARYLIGRAELDFLDADDDSHEVRQPSVDPLLAAGLVDVVDDTADAGHAITDEVRTIPTPGHTPGHVAVLIESAGRTALITGDTFHTPLQLTHPELVATRFDWDPAMATATRRRLVERHLEADTLVIGTHFPPPTAGRVRRGDRGTWLAS
jgi:glyoxylase-like metal-dependent hydrolase (beta-lactamase superfamily II)